MNPLIKIEIEDVRRYADVAFLVDREDFLNDLVRLRKRFGFESVRKYDSGKHWAANRWDVNSELLLKHSDAVAPFEDKLQDTNYMSDLTIAERNKLYDEYQKASRILPENAFFQDIQKLRRKYKKSPNFDRIIAHAVIYGEVRDDDYVTCEIGIDYPEIEFVDYDKEAKPAITFYPLVQMDDIKKLLEEKVEEVLKKYQKEVLDGTLIDYDTRPNIKRDRDWYWKKRSGLSYSAIHKQGENISRDAVIKAIQQYQRTLSMEL